MADEEGVAEQVPESTRERAGDDSGPPVGGAATPGGDRDSAARRRLGRRDWLAAAGIGVLVALSPLTPNEWLPSFGIGAALGALYLGFRRRSAAALGGEETPAPGVRPAAAAPAVPANVWLCLVVSGALFAPTIAWMFGQWRGSVWHNNHGIFVPVLMFFLLRSVLRQHGDRPDEPAAVGFVWLGLGAALAVADAAAQTHYLAAVGLVIALPGLSLLLLGRQRTHDLRFALLLGIFMLPLPTTAFHHVFLRNATAGGVAPLLGLLGIPSVREHTVLTLPDGVFLVGDACSGFNSAYAGLALATFLVCYARHWPRRLLLLASFLPIAIAANVVRVLALILMARWAGLSLLDTALHEATGVASFLIVITSLLALADRRALREAFA